MLLKIKQETINHIRDKSLTTRVAANGGFKGSLTGISIGADVTSTQKIWHSLQALGDIAFAYSFSNILIEIQVRKSFYALL